MKCKNMNKRKIKILLRLFSKNIISEKEFILLAEENLNDNLINKG